MVESGDETSADDKLLPAADKPDDADDDDDDEGEAGEAKVPALE